MIYYSLFLFLLVPILGFLILRFLLGINSLIFLLPFSLVLGVSIFLDLIHLCDPLLGIQNGTFLSLIIIFLSTLSLLIYNKKKLFEKIDNPLKLNQYFILLSTILFVIVFTYLVSDKWVMLDFKFHLSQVNNFVRTNRFPVGIPESPSLLIPYHYGFDLFCASISKLLGMSAISTFRLVIVLFSVITFLSGFALSYLLVSDLQANSFLSGSKFTNSFIGALLFYFSGNLLWLDAIFRYVFKIFPVQSNWSIFKTACAIGFHGGIVNDISNACVFFASLSIGLGLSLLLFFLYIKFIQQEKFCIKTFVIMFFVSISLFHCAEYILYAFSLSVLLSPFISKILKEKITFKENVLKSFACFLYLPAVLFVNSLTYIFESSKYTYMPAFLELELNTNLPFIETFGRFGNINEHAFISLFSWDFISEMGLPFVFIVLIVIWMIKTKSKWCTFFLSFFLISFTSPFILYIKSSPPDSLRLLHPGLEMLNMFFAFYMLSLINKTNIKLLKLTLNTSLILMIAPQLIKLILAGIFSLNIYLNYLFIDNINILIKNLIVEKDISNFSSTVSYYVSTIKKSTISDDSDKRLAIYLDKNYIDGNCGFSMKSTGFNLVGIPCYNPIAGATCREFTFATFLRTLDPYLGKEMNIRWIYIDPLTEGLLNISELQNLIKLGLLKEVFSVSSIFYPKPLKLYEFIDLENYIKNNPRKTYWTYLRYMTSDIIPISNQNGEKVIYLFKSEKEADAYLKEMIKVNPLFKSYKPFTQAVDINMLKLRFANFNLKYF